MNALVPVRISGQIEDGTFIKALDYCKVNCGSGLCKVFYDNITQKDCGQFLVCPHGMSVYITENAGVLKYFVSLRNKDAYDKKKAKKISNNSDNVIYNPVLDTEKLLQLIDYSCKIEQESFTLSEKKASIERTAHEAKKLNARIKEHSGALLQTYDADSDECLSLQDKRAILDKIKTIYVSSSIAHGRFALLDYERNPHVLKNGAMYDGNVHKKFRKIQKIFSSSLDTKVPIRINGNSFKCIRAYPSFEMIPLLLVENAVKYSYPDNSVEINFTEAGKDLIVEICSFSPFCTKNELDQVFLKGFRGENASKTTDGSGIGLFFVKMLCDLHNIDISVSSGVPTATINGIDYAQFVVRLCFKNVYQV